LTGPAVLAVSVADGTLEQAARQAPPGMAVLAGRSDTSPAAPMLSGRHPIEGHDTAYLCRGTVCQAPITDPAALRRALSAA
ncbi:MAG: hypothetical protein WA892_07850, partial [Ornithinimicrobium sp.]